MNNKERTGGRRDVPISGPYQYIFQNNLESIVETGDMLGYRFRFIDSFLDLNGTLLKQMYSFWGPKMFLKSIVKIMTPSRKFYCLISEKEPIHKMVTFGWIEVGRCKRYTVDKKDVAFDLIWTVEDERGRGLATYSLKNALSCLFKRGYRRAYIDTFIDNAATQRLFKRCGFQGPVSFYLRTDKQQSMDKAGDQRSEDPAR